MKTGFSVYLISLFLLLFSFTLAAETDTTLISEQIKKETLNAWNAYKKYAWGHDELNPLSKSYRDWYSSSLYITAIDAYSTLKLMGFENEASEIENYITDHANFDKDIFVKTFEVNIRILGGLLSMYELSQNKKILDIAIDFGNRILPAFNSKTGIPYYWVNLKTGRTKGDIVNVAEGGTYLIEMGKLSEYTHNPVYYEKAKNADIQIFSRRSPLNLVGQDINIETGQWIDSISHIGACIDSYYEYLYKGWLLFKDPDLKNMWETSIEAVLRYMPDQTDTSLWFAKVNMYTAEKMNNEVTLWDAYFPALLALSGHIAEAEKCQKSWNWLWNKYKPEPMIYDYKKNEIINPGYDLNPEIIESAFYLYYFTKDAIYQNMATNYYNDLMRFCKTNDAFCSLENMLTKKQVDHLPSFFFAETMKYLFLAFNESNTVNLTDYVFNTEGHPFRIIH